MEVILPILGIAWGILCIILFFKIWKACNQFNRFIESTNLTMSGKAMILSGDFENGLPKLKCELGNALLNAYQKQDYYPAEKKAEAIQKLIDEYKPYFDFAKVQMPEHMTSANTYIERIDKFI